MALEPEFTPAAIAYLQAHADCGGVAGRAEMDEAQSYEFKSRKQRIHKIYPLGPSRWLCGGGLFRRCAIEQIGYLTNRNLHGYEEAELGIRLRQAGYRLERLNVPFFFHRSHTLDSLALIRYRWRMGYLFASGELVRSAWRQPYWREALTVIRSELLFGLYLLVLLISLLCWGGGASGWLPCLRCSPARFYHAQDRQEPLPRRCPAQRHESLHLCGRAGAWPAAAPAASPPGPRPSPHSGVITVKVLFANKFFS